MTNHTLKVVLKRGVLRCGLICTVMDVFGEGVPEGGSHYGEGPVTPGLVLSSKWRRQEVGIRGAEAVVRSVTVEQVGEIAWGLVMEGFVGKKEDFQVDALRSGSQWSFWRTGVMWSQ